MTHSLVLVHEPDKGLGENVFLKDLPLDYKVYMFFYPLGADKALIEKLKEFGEETGNNCFVNFAKLNDPDYNKMRHIFNIMTLPTIIVTATGDMASSSSEYSTAFVKIDNPALLKSSDETFRCIMKVYNLFIDQKLSEAMKQKTKDERIAVIKSVLNDALGEFKGFLKEWNVSFSFLGGKLELKPK